MQASFGDRGSEEWLLRSRRNALRSTAWFEMVVALCAAISYVSAESNALRSGQLAGWPVRFAFAAATTYGAFGAGRSVRSLAVVVPRADPPAWRDWKKSLGASSSFGVGMSVWAYANPASNRESSGAGTLLVEAAAFALFGIVLLALTEKARA